MELRGLVGHCLDVPSLFPLQVPCRDTYLLHHRIVPFQEKFLGVIPLQFLVCSAFPQLINRFVLELRLNWVALHYHSRRQKLAFLSNTPTLWHTSHRVSGSLPDQVSILVAWFFDQVWVGGGVRIDAFACDKALASGWCQNYVPGTSC